MAMSPYDAALNAEAGFNLPVWSAPERPAAAAASPALARTRAVVSASLPPVDREAPRKVSKLEANVQTMFRLDFLSNETSFTPNILKPYMHFVGTFGVRTKREHEGFFLKLTANDGKTTLNVTPNRDEATSNEEFVKQLKSHKQGSLGAAFDDCSLKEAQLFHETAKRESEQWDQLFDATYRTVHAQIDEAARFTIQYHSGFLLRTTNRPGLIDLRDKHEVFLGNQRSHAYEVEQIAADRKFEKARAISNVLDRAISTSNEAAKKEVEGRFSDQKPSLVKQEMELQSFAQ